MKLEKVSNEQVDVRLTEDELRLVIGALREVVEVIDDFEFYARVGGEKKQASNLCVVLKEAAENAGVDM
ncbi:MAG: hypothetical protein HGA96_14395 [Desulfobulbaceae bacterium]|nr:hypothetical protein [Desulfobulbaceae bacterium]